MGDTVENAVVLKVGAGVGTPASGTKAVFVDTDGTVKVMDSTATVSALGGTAMVDFLQTAGGDIQDLTVSGLNGDTDGDYEFEIDLIYKGGSGAVGFQLRPFGSTITALNCSYQSNNGSDALSISHAFEAGGFWIVGSVNNAGDVHMTFKGSMTSKTGRYRQYFGSGSSAYPTSIFSNLMVSGWASDTATVISALTVHASVAASIRANSAFKVRALKKTL